MSDEGTRRLQREAWKGSVRVGPRRAPLLSPEWLAEQGRTVRVVDVRPEEAFTGPLGHIPGSVRVDLDRVSEVVAHLPPDAPVVVVSEDGEVAGSATVYLQSLGLAWVAALDGGLRAWRSRGFSVSHDPAAARRDLSALQLIPPPPRALGALSRAEIEAHVGAPGSVRWVKLASFLLYGKRSCVDGRDEQGVLGTPGGDAGEFLLAVAGLERHQGVVVTDEEVAPLLRAYLLTFGRFYMHTDLHTVEHLAEAMRADPRLADVAPAAHDVAAWGRFLNMPPRAVREVVLEHLVDAAHVGCGHLKLMYQSPETYGVRRALFEAFLRAYWRLLWQGVPELEHVTLGGDHQEGAVINVLLAEEVWPFTMVPVVSPSYGGVQMFVNHPQVSLFLRRQAARFLVRTCERAKGLDPEALATTLAALGDAQAGATLHALARGLPVYDVTFGGEARVEVVEQGVIG